MLALLLCLGLVWNIRHSPMYPVLLSIRDAEPFAEAAGVRTAYIKVGVFALSAAMAGGAGWLFSFLGVVSPGQFDWSVSLNILVMVLVGGINTTLGPVIGAMFVSMFPVIVNINPWLQEIVSVRCRSSRLRCCRKASSGWRAGFWRGREASAPRTPPCAYPTRRRGRWRPATRPPSRWPTPGS